MKNILLVAAENSAETYAVQIVKEFAARGGGFHFWGIGGDRLAANGFENLVSNRDLSVVGIIEVLAHIFRIRRVLNLVLRRALERRADAAGFSAVVEEAHHDRHAGGPCDVVEARLPVIDVAASPLDGYDETHGIGGDQSIGHLLDEALAAIPLDRDPAEQSHEPPVGPAKQCVLADPTDLHFEMVCEGQHPDEVPVARVRRCDQHVPSRLGRAALDMPAAEPQQQIR